ncbi:MAG: VCBS repeat-containing protein [Thermoanaerobaculia bacterium]
MKRSRTVRLVILGLALSACPGDGRAAAPPAPAAVAAPVLKWQRGGCTSFCKTGWYSSPAVADLDGDGLPDVIWGSSDVVALNGSNGSLKWRGASGNRVWPGVAIADLTGDGTLEVVVGRNSDQLTVYDRLGSILFTRNPFGGGEVRTLAVTDLENDGQLEIVVGRGSGGATQQLSVYEPDGTVRPGWPARRNGEVGNGWGMYNENVAVADMNDDGYAEVFGPTDTHYITALDRGGNQLSTNSIYNTSSPAGAKVWSQVGVHVDQAVDLRGYADCPTERRPNFANSAPVIADLNGDGVPELVVIGNVYDCSTNPYTDLYAMPFILKEDRSRWSGSGFDWTVLPVPGPGSAPLSQDYNVIESCVLNPAIGDLDGDGFAEIVFPSYDGKVHAYSLDKLEHDSWPYVIPGIGIHFAGEPVIADLDNDGFAEVIFTSWGQKSLGQNGQLHILSHLGAELHRIDLPAPFGDSYNGGLAAPTLANIDADADLELVIGTVASGVVAYDLPGTANARVLWGTGRGGVRRTGRAALRSQPPSGALSFHTLVPCRVLDTRNAAGALGGPAIGGFGARTFVIAGSCGVPAGAKSVSANVTVVNTGSLGVLSIHPGDADRTLATAMSFPPGRTRANNAQARLSSDGAGRLRIVNGATSATHVILDVNGYFQ